MKWSISLCALAAAIVVAATGPVSAQQPPAKGRVLVLDNQQILEGEIERQGDLYVIRRPLGELKVPVAKALTVCANLEDTYKYLLSRAKLSDGEERLRLARWCQMHGLREQAVAEAKAALQLRPEHFESTQLLTMLESAGRKGDFRPPETSKAPEPVPTSKKQPIADTSTQAPVAKTAAVAASDPPATVYRPPSPPLDTAPPLEVSGDCLAVFNNKIQPILMNTCASCHATGRGGAFVLTRATDAAGQRITQMNLTATIKQISFEQPSASPILHKACCAHGGGQAALANRQAVPFMTLQAWVEFVAASNPQLKMHGAKAVAVVPLPLVNQKAVEKTSVAVIPAVANVVAVPNATGMLPATHTTIEKTFAYENPLLASQPAVTAPPIARPVEIERNPLTINPMMPRTVAIQESPSPAAVPGPQGTPRLLSGDANAQQASEFDPMLFNRMWHAAQR